MMRRTFGVKCGRPGSAFDFGLAARAGSPRISARPSAPRPRAALERKCRRVIASGSGWSMVLQAPVFGRQVRHLPKVTLVARHQDRARRERDGSDPAVLSSDAEP